MIDTIPCTECGWLTEDDVDRLVCEQDGAVICDACAPLHAAHMLEAEG